MSCFSSSWSKWPKIRWPTRGIVSQPMLSRWRFQRKTWQTEWVFLYHNFISFLGPKLVKHISGMSDFSDKAEFCASAQLSETPRSSLILCPHFAPVSGLVAATRDGDFAYFSAFAGFFWATNARVWMGIYQLHVIACNLDLSRVLWSEICAVTAQIAVLFFFYSKSIPIPT